MGQNGNGVDVTVESAIRASHGALNNLIVVSVNKRRAAEEPDRASRSVHARNRRAKDRREMAAKLYRLISPRQVVRKNGGSAMSERSARIACAVSKRDLPLRMRFFRWTTRTTSYLVQSLNVIESFVVAHTYSVRLPRYGSVSSPRQMVPFLRCRSEGIEFASRFASRPACS